MVRAISYFAGLSLLLVGILGDTADAGDRYLVIGGGYSPTGNQVSLEKNVLFFQRLLAHHGLVEKPVDVFFADGLDEGRDLQVNDVSKVPLANRLMAEFFASSRDLGMHYRSHQVPNIRGATSPENLAKWFKEEGSRMESGDRLVLYVTAHGGGSTDKSKPHNTTIYMWNNKRVSVLDLVKHLDALPDGVSVVTVMVQCHAGGFARYIFEEGDAGKGLSRSNRCGFFATVHDRPAAGCTADIDEANYQEYSSFFWSAIGGQNRNGEPIEAPDYDENGFVSFEEAHAYTLLTSNTIDLPIKTSGEFLRAHSRFAGSDDENLIAKSLTYAELTELASPVQFAILEGLSKQLKLEGDNRFAVARSKSRRTTGRGTTGRGSANRGSAPNTRSPSNRGRRSSSPAGQLKAKIGSDLKRRWPELANVLSPVAIELVTTRSTEFVSALERHPKYKEYRKLRDGEANAASSSISPDRLKVKYERWVRVAENVILAENFRRIADSNLQERFRQMLEAEQSSILPRAETIEDKLKEFD